MSFCGLCVLFHLFQAVVSQAVLSQFPALLTADVGSLVKLQCQSGRLAPGIVYWYTHWPREGMRLVYKTGRFVTPGGRFSGEVCKQSGNYSLVIDNVQRNDSGRYYCAAPNAGNRTLIFGTGTTLVITAGPPVLFLLTPPPAEIPRLERVPLMCLVRGAAPDSSPIRWLVAGRAAEGRSEPGTLEPDGSYTARSVLSVSAETWRSGAVCTCTVPINATGDLLSESVASPGEPLHSSTCRFALYASLAMAPLVMGLIGVAVARRGKTRQPESAATTDRGTASRIKKAEEETMYAHLAFAVD
uniref:immunoglobulin kappa light chain-like n=1 Tax=Pristiophorus japonicus TaxID=55135 RepID=UPI00398F1FAB